jgi:hypothetical protein
VHLAFAASVFKVSIRSASPKPLVEAPQDFDDILDATLIGTNNRCFTKAGKTVCS